MVLEWDFTLTVLTSRAPLEVLTVIFRLDGRVNENFFAIGLLPPGHGCPVRRWSRVGSSTSNTRLKSALLISRKGKP